MWGTLRVVTARELVVLSGSFTSHSKSARRLHHFMWSCKPQEIHSLQCWRARNKSPQAYPVCTRDWTWGRRMTGTHATTCAIATLLSLDRLITTGAIRGWQMVDNGIMETSQFIFSGTILWTDDGWWITNTWRCSFSPGTVQIVSLPPKEQNACACTSQRKSVLQ